MESVPVEKIMNRMTQRIGELESTNILLNIRLEEVLAELERYKITHGAKQATKQVQDATED